jgi:hypothetical protein
MTKKLVILTIAAAFVCVQAAPSLAANPDTGPGCGLGKLAWSDYKGQKAIPIPAQDVDSANSRGRIIRGRSKLRPKY